MPPEEKEWRADSGLFCGGFFVEAGANTGVNSVTRAFEQIGWHGLCVEANPHLFHDFLVKNKSAA